MYIRALEKHKKNQNKKKHFMIVNGVLLLKRVMLKIVAIATKNKLCIEAADIFKFALPLLFFLGHCGNVDQHHRISKLAFATSFKK